MSNVIPFVPTSSTVQTAPRPTPTPARVQFSDVLAGGAQALVRGAQAAVNSLPGLPLAAVAVRGGGLGSSGGAGSGGLGLEGGRVTTSALSVGTSPEGPGGAVPLASLANVGSGVGSGVSVGSNPNATSGTSDGGLESSMAQSEQMNLYYLQIQEEVNAQNRTFTALSNVLEVEHSTAKSAIGNIH